MTTDLGVRKATTDDVEAIQWVARRVWHEIYDFIDEDAVEELLAQGYSAEFLEAAIERPELTLFVAERGAEDDSEVVGYASCEPPGEDGVGEVSVYVHPDWWRKGIGTALLDRAEAFLRGQGAAAVEDTVLAKNTVGNAFYADRYDRIAETTVDFGGTEYESNVYRREL